MTRRPEPYDGPGEPVGADVLRPASLDAALAAPTSRSTSSTRSTTPTSSARTPRPPATSAPRPPRPGCGRSSTWAGSATTTRTCRPTCARAARSRSLLGRDGVPVTVLRAAIVVGHGGISWEITRQLVKNLPAMVVPKWVAHAAPSRSRSTTWSATSPGWSTTPRPSAGSSRSAAPSSSTYLDMMLVAAEIVNGRKIPIVPVPRADAAAVVVLAGAGHRRRRDDRPQPHRLDVDRGGRDATPRSATWCRASRCRYEESVRRALAEAAEQLSRRAAVAGTASTATR